MNPLKVPTDTAHLYTVIQDWYYDLHKRNLDGPIWTYQSNQVRIDYDEHRNWLTTTKMQQAPPDGTGRTKRNINGVYVTGSPGLFVRGVIEIETLELAPQLTQLWLNPLPGFEELAFDLEAYISKAYSVYSAQLAETKMAVSRDVTDIYQIKEPPNMSPTTADLRKFLTNHFTSDEFTALCYDYFREVYNTFATGMSGGQRIQALIEHVHKRELEPKLLQVLQQERPEQFAKYLKPADSPAPVSSPVPQSPTHTASVPVTTDVSGGVTIEGRKEVSVDGDVVGRDKLVQANTYIEHATIIQTSASAHELKTINAPSPTVNVLRFPNKPMLPGKAWLNDPVNRRVIGDMEVVRIPAGKFLMGSTDDDDYLFYDERPQHTIEILYDYWLGRYLVTNEQFARFVSATKYQFDQGNWEKQANYPVIGTSWHDALAYCDWLGAHLSFELMNLIVRLPTEAEWEKAARGEHGNVWPWGNRFDKTKCNSGEGGKTGTTPVGAYSLYGDSPYGVADMVGNVREWCHSLYRPYPYKVGDGREDKLDSGPRIVRGGAWNANQKTARCANRDKYSPANFYFRDLFGFRVVIAPPLPG